MAAQPSQKPIHSIIIDTGPLIKNAISISTIINSAEVLYTTPDIISEIRDPATRSRVETTLLPFLNIKTPSPASYEAVVAFSKKTGDFSVLSKQDLGILALAYEVHVEKNGGPWGLRSTPKGSPAQKPGKKTAAEKSAEKQVEGATETPKEAVVAEHQPEQQSQETPAAESAQQEAAAVPSTDAVQAEVVSEAQPVEEPAQEAESAGKETEAIEQELANLQVSNDSQATQEPVQTTIEEDEDSDGGEWITPSNVTKHKAKDASADNAPLREGEPQMDVATMTTDFAMQNVLLQMGMQLLSTNMQRIRRARAQVLRCHACFLVCREMDKQFCPRCGQPTLKRVSCSTNSKGHFMIHLSNKYHHSNRGNKYSIPKPVAGSSNGKLVGKGGGQHGWGRELLLSEDQKEYQQQVTQEKKSKTRDLMDNDYLPNILTGDRGRAGGRPKVGAGRNINSRKRF